jgi:hypothetical protein
MRQTTKILLTMSAAALFASACNPEIGGEEGNLTLTYNEGPIGGATGSSPLAVGAKLDYSAMVNGNKEQKVSFDAATAADDKIIRVDGVNGGLMTLEGVADGETTIDVEATAPDGEALTDSFELEAATVDALEFDNPCAKDAEALYLVDHDINLHYTMRAAGKIAVGYGHYPVEFEPADAATLGDSTVNGLLPLRTPGTPGEISVKSQVDDTTFALTLIEQGDIDGAKIFEQDFLDESNFPVEVDKSLTLHLLPTASGLLPAVQEPVPVCQSDITIEATATTSDTCEVAYEARTSDDGLFNLYEPNVLKVTGKAEGSCEIDVSIPGADGGNGITETFTFDVRPASETNDQQENEG